jgi:hypothetical protein
VPVVAMAAPALNTWSKSCAKAKRTPSSQRHFHFGEYRRRREKFLALAASRAPAETVAAGSRCRLPRGRPSRA